MVKKVAILGAGGFAREVVDVLEACNQQSHMYDIVGFIVDAEYGKAGELINDRPILGDLSWLERHASDVRVLCGVGIPELRRALVIRAEQVGARFFNAMHPMAVCTRWVSMGVGIVITAGCVITNQIIIGNHAHINLNCTIGHDSIIGDFVTLAPGVNVSGNVEISEGTSVGTGTTIIERIAVGPWAVIGAGSTIIRDVPANSTSVGVPGKVIKTRQEGWHLPGMTSS